MLGTFDGVLDGHDSVDPTLRQIGLIVVRRDR